LVGAAVTNGAAFDGFTSNLLMALLDQSQLVVVVSVFLVLVVGV